MSGSQDEIPPPPSSSQTPAQQTPHTVSTIKLPILKKGEYDIWAMKMEHYLAHTDYLIWEVILLYQSPQIHKTKGISILVGVRRAWNSGNRMGERSVSRKYSKAFGDINGEGVDWTRSPEKKKICLMGLQQLRLRHREIKAYTQGLKKVEAQVVAHQQGQLWYEEKIRFLKIDLDDKTDVLTYHKKLLAEAQKEIEDLKAIVEKWHNSSKNLGKLLNTQMSANDKFGLGYGDHRYDSILSYENEVLQSVYCSVETHESLPEPTVNEPKVVNQPKVWSDAPIIEEYELDSEDEYVSQPTKEQEQPSFASTNKQVKTPWETVKNQFTYSKNPTVDKKGLGYGFTTRACFAVLTNAAIKVNIVKPIVNRVRPANVNTAKVNAVSAVGGKGKLLLSPQQVVIGDKKDITGKISPNTIVDQDYLHRALKHKRIVDSGCSMHMTGNKAYLAEYQDFNGGLVAFGGCKGYITGKEFKNRILLNSVGQKGSRGSTVMQNSQQNGVAERKNKTLIEAARTMLADSFLPNTFWAEAVSTACYVLRKGPTWLFDLDYLNDSMNYQPVRSKNQANKHAGPQEANHNAGTKDNIDAGDSEKEDESAQDYFVLPIWSSYSSTVKRSTEKDAGEAPTKHPNLKTDENPIDKEDQVFLDELERLKRQEKDTNDAAEALRKEFAQETKDLLLQVGAAKTSMADFTNLEPVVNVSPIPTSRINSIHTSTLILGDPQSAVQTRNLPYEKKAIGMKWVYRNKKDERGVVVRNKARLVAQGHRQEEGIDYDEVFAPVARIEAIRIFLAFASYMGFIVYQMDMKSALLYGKIYEEVYVSQPPGFIDPKYPQKVYKVIKSLYGLHQVSRACSTFFLGLQVKQKEDGIFISQDKYVAEILKKFDFVSVKTASTPIETQKPLVKDEEASDVDVHLYRSMIGSLMYLTASRPDIMFAVCACSRFQVTPKTSHLSAVKRIFRYLKGKPKLGLWYPRVSSFDLEAYSDSDYAGANLDRKSTTGGCQFLGRRLIFWQCKKQTIVATSTTEAEYVAAANCCGQVLWIQNQMLDYGFNFMNTKIYIDNESTICIVKNPVYHFNNKDID
ncbi:putative ribonuclease H-like domain-containing protein [Tanacetum coccineum]